jgi:rubredoxin
MKFPANAFERTADVVAAAPMARFECGVCWHVYDPAAGDPQAQVPAGTPFAALPEHWSCPGCEAARERFLPIDDGDG